jgi:hypothetical protein
VWYAQTYTPPWEGQRPPNSATAAPAGARKTTKPMIHMPIEAQPPPAMIEEPPMKKMMNT